MGTNYYVEWVPGGRGNQDAPASLLPSVAGIRLHICKNLTSFQGKVFNSWSAWKNFLESNEWHLTIRDEYGVEHEVVDFVTSVEAVSADARSRQYRWMVEHYRPEQRPDDWLDAEGYSFHRGEFS